MAFLWSELKKPIFILAPMEDVTDCSFREMFALHGKPDLLFTEFVSTDGLMHEEGRKKLKIDLAYTEIQRPIIAQIWGATPEKFYEVAKYIVELGFDGIDINMGCPQTKEIAIGACAALIRTPKLAQEIIAATKKGAGNLPVSVKTRIGYSKPEEMEEWLTCLLEMDLPAITLHARTKKEMSKVPAHWEKIAEAVRIRDKVQGSRDKKDRTVIIGNGDVQSYQEGLDRIAETGADGVMVGRGAFGNPWFFKTFGGENPKESQGFSPSNPADSKSASSPFHSFVSPEVNSMTDNLYVGPSVRDRLTVMLEHAELFEKMYSGIKSFSIMRKHFKAYCSGFPGASELRVKLMETTSFEETKKIVTDYLK
jgi:tRNA-dihydrouridine synthase